MTIFLGADHDGWVLKEELKIALQSQGHKVSDQGNLLHEAEDDYPDFAKKVAIMMKKNPKSIGILICDSGQGMMMAANRFKHLRAAFGYSQEAIIGARQDEDANVLCLIAKELNLKKALNLIETFLNTPFSKKLRHKRRIQKLKKL